MHRVRHGRLSIELPEGWSDRSTLLFVGPAPALPAAQTQRVAQPSVSITMVRTRGEAPLAEARAILDEELAGLRSMNLGLEVLGVEEIESGLGRGVASTQRLTLDGVRITQMHAVFVAGQLGVRAVASVGDTGDDGDLRRWIASLSWEGTA